MKKTFLTHNCQSVSGGTVGTNHEGVTERKRGAAVDTWGDPPLDNSLCVQSSLRR